MYVAYMAKHSCIETNFMRWYKCNIQYDTAFECYRSLEFMSLFWSKMLGCWKPGFWVALRRFLFLHGIVKKNIHKGSSPKPPCQTWQNYSGMILRKPLTKLLRLCQSVKAVCHRVNKLVLVHKTIFVTITTWLRRGVLCLNNKSYVRFKQL